MVQPPKSTTVVRERSIKLCLKFPLNKPGSSKVTAQDLPVNNVSNTTMEEDSLEDFKSPKKRENNVKPKRTNSGQKSVYPVRHPGDNQSTQEILVTAWKKAKADDTEYLSENEFQIFKQPKLKEMIIASKSLQTSAKTDGNSKQASEKLETRKKKSVRRVKSAFQGTAKLPELVSPAVNNQSVSNQNPRSLRKEVQNIKIRNIIIPDSQDETQIHTDTTDCSQKIAPDHSLNLNNVVHTDNIENCKNDIFPLIDLKPAECFVKSEYGLEPFAFEIWKGKDNCIIVSKPNCVPIKVLTSDEARKLDKLSSDEDQNLIVHDNREKELTLCSVKTSTSSQDKARQPEKLSSDQDNLIVQDNREEELKLCSLKSSPNLQGEAKKLEKLNSDEDQNSIVDDNSEKEMIICNAKSLPSSQEARKLEKLITDEDQNSNVHDHREEERILCNVKSSPSLQDNDKQCESSQSSIKQATLKYDTPEILSLQQSPIMQPSQSGRVAESTSETIEDCCSLALKVAAASQNDETGLLNATNSFYPKKLRYTLIRSLWWRSRFLKRKRLLPPSGFCRLDIRRSLRK